MALTAKRALGLEQNGWGVTVGGSGLSVTGAASANENVTNNIVRERHKEWLICLAHELKYSDTKD